MEPSLPERLPAESKSIDLAPREVVEDMTCVRDTPSSNSSSATANSSIPSSAIVTCSSPRTSSISSMPSSAPSISTEISTFKAERQLLACHQIA